MVQVEGIPEGLREGLLDGPYEGQEGHHEADGNSEGDGGGLEGKGDRDGSVAFESLSHGDEGKEGDAKADQDSWNLKK